MPIFILRCKECGMVFDYFKLKEADVPLCPKCANTEDFDKLPTAAALSFKGEGWQTTNFNASIDPTSVPGVKKIDLDKQTITQKTLYRGKKELTGRRKKVKIKGLPEKKAEWQK